MQWFTNRTATAEQSATKPSTFTLFIQPIQTVAEDVSMGALGPYHCVNLCLRAFVRNTFT